MGRQDGLKQRYYQLVEEQMGSKMNVDAIKFPVICFWKDFIRIKQSYEDIIITTKAGLKNKMFDDLLVVDSNSHAFKILNAKKLHGVGSFWGYNIFLNQKIKVELEFEGDPIKFSIDDIKKKVFHSFRKWHGWRARGDFKELYEKVKNAQSISEIIELLS